MKEEKVNNVSVKPVVVPDGNEAEKIKGYNIIPFKYYNMFICSKKKSGKTSLINTIIRKTTDKRSNIWIFCSTYKLDDTWKAIIQFLEERGNNVNCFDTIMDGKVNLLDKIVEGLNEPEEVPEKKGKEPVNLNEIKRSYDIFGKERDAEGKPKKEYVPKKQSPKHLFIIDDLSSQLKYVDKLLKIHRHFKASVILSSQYLNDLSPSSRLQIDIFAAFRSFSEEKLEVVHKSLDLSIPFEVLWNVYQQVTSENYQFLYINIRTEELRKNLNVKLTFD
jgi:hypothetical protein